MKKILLTLGLLVIGIFMINAFAEEGSPPKGGPGMSPAPEMGPAPGMSPRPGMGPGRGQPMRWWDNPRLNLSPEQKTKLEALSQAHQQEVTPLRNSLLQKRQELETLLGQAQLDKGKILAKHKEVTAVQNSMDEKRLEFEIGQRQILTPEQRTLLGTMKPQPRGPRGER